DGHADAGVLRFERPGRRRREGRAVQAHGEAVDHEPEEHEPEQLGLVAGAGDHEGGEHAQAAELRRLPLAQRDREPTAEQRAERSRANTAVPLAIISATPPATSNRTLGTRGVSGRARRQRGSISSATTACMAKRPRQVSPPMSGPPRRSPITGALAPANAHAP